ncbi:archease [Candidatus Woesearchaeota archaeon]|nr:archease [Candidatus Woesearchaeota archaeon]
MQKPYLFLEHTADAKFQAFGKDQEEAFGNAALAFTAVMTDVSKVEKNIQRKFEVTASTKEGLLFDFLQEMVVLLDVEGFISAKASVSITKANGVFTLKATLHGDLADHYDMTAYIKAMTYSDMFIKETPTSVTLQVVVDI